MSYATLYFLLAAIVLWRSYRQAGTPSATQQLKWISRGTVLAIGPYTLFYVLPYLAGAVPTFAMKVSVLSLVFLPVTLGYAIVRYRLMDVDMIFKRGVAYTLATAAIVMALLRRHWRPGRICHYQVPEYRHGRADRGHHHHRADLRAPEELVPGPR